MKRKKKSLQSWLCLCLAVCLLAVGSVPSAAAELPSISAEGYCVIDASTGELIVGSNEQKSFAPASITKIMTLLVAVEQCGDLSQTVVTTETALTELELMSSTLSPMPKPGEVFSVHSLLLGLIMRSGNECANLIAEHIAGSTEAFAELMNQKAAQIGAVNTHFSNAHGLDADDHYTTPYDMALIMKAALEHPSAKEILSAREFTIPATAYSAARPMKSGHGMMNGEYSCAGVYAGKTGYTVNAQWTLVTAATRQDRNLIAVVMKCNEGCNYSDTATLLSFAEQKLQGVEPSGGGQVYDPQLTAYDSNGFTMSWKVGPDVYMAEFPVWIEYDETDQVTKDNIVASGNGTISYRVNLADHGGKAGVYTVQAYVYDKSGNKNVNTVKILAGVNPSDYRPGMIQWNDAWYYVRDNGSLALNWLETETDCYYFDYTTGQRQTGWITSGNTTYYLDEEGKLVSGWQEIDGNTYLFQVPGDMVTGTWMTADFPCYFNSDGVFLGAILPSDQGQTILNSILPDEEEIEEETESNEMEEVYD